LHRFFKSSLAVLLATAGATGLRYVSNPAFGSRAPLLFHLLAVAIAAQTAGTLAGLGVAGLSIILIGYSAPPSDVFMPTILAIFGLVGITVSILVGWQKRLKDELHLAYERIALKHEIARMGSFDWLVDGDRFVASPEMKVIYGVKPPFEVNTFEEWKAFIHSEDRPGTIAGLEETAKLRLPTFDATYRIVRGDGEIRWIHSRRKLHYDQTGTLVHVVGICMDVTDVKQGEMAQEILGGLLQVCSACRRIHDAGTEEWYSMEGYLRQHVPAKFSHGMCPDCSRQWLAESGPKLMRKA